MQHLDIKYKKKKNAEITSSMIKFYRISLKERIRNRREEERGGER